MTHSGSHGLDLALWESRAVVGALEGVTALLLSSGGRGRGQCPSAFSHETRREVRSSQQPQDHSSTCPDCQDQFICWKWELGLQAAGCKDRRVWAVLPGLRPGAGGPGIPSCPALPCQLLPPGACVGPGPRAGCCLCIVDVPGGS